MERTRQLKDSLSDGYILDLYSKYKDNPQIKWKDSIKKIVGIEIPIEPGLDI
jgi:hypothetical protein